MKRKSTALALLLASVLLAACTTTTVTTSGGERVSAASDRPPLRATEGNAVSRARSRADLAAGYYRNGQLTIALEEARRATALDPNFAEAYGLLALIHMDMGDRSAAEENFQRALKLDGANPHVNHNYGWFLCQTERERESIDYFNRALRDPLYGTPAKANQNAGACLMRIKDFRAAEPYLRRSFELDASSALTAYHLSRTYLASGQVDRAAFYYNLLVKSTDSSAETLWLGLRIARANGDLRTETQLANELRERFPRSAEVAALARGAFDD
jgi:type IV pilus assembly protein PilF